MINNELICFINKVKVFRLCKGIHFQRHLKKLSAPDVSLSINLKGFLRNNFIFIPAVCRPACQHGGTCIYHNTCQCPQNFAGAQCQHSIERCAPTKIGFNGGVRCTGTSTGMSCILHCPEGIRFDSPPAAAYKCSFDKGVFTPSNVPRCVYDEGVEVIQRSAFGAYDQDEGLKC